jgi:O-antigen/teichoic acid export membrane protein
MSDGGAGGGRHRRGGDGGGISPAELAVRLSAPQSTGLLTDPEIPLVEDGPAPDGQPGDEPGDLGRKVRRSLSWSFAGTLFSRLTNLLSGIILARVLVPEDYGVFAVATVALALLVNINDLGMEQALVRWPGDIARIASTGVTLIFGFSAVLFVVFFAAAGPFSSALGAPEATGIVRLLAVCILINGAFAVPSAMLTRHFRHDLRTYADLSGFIVTTGLTLLLALLGFGPWSLAWGRLVGNTVNSGLHFILTPVRYRPGWDRDAARQLLSGGLPLAGATVLAVAMVNVDNVIVGRSLGPTVLGLYVLAFSLSSWPVNLLSVPVQKVSIPAFARLQHDLPRLRRAFTTSLGLLMALAVPVCGLLAILALPAIRFLYGEKWAGAATALSFLAALGLARVALQLCFDLLVAVGHGRMTMVLQGVWLALLIPALIIGAEVGGIRGVGIAHMTVAVGVMVPAFLAALGRLGIRTRDLARALVRPAAGAVVLCVVPIVALRTLQPDILILAVGGIGGVLCYLPVVAALRSQLRELRSA